MKTKIIKKIIPYILPVCGAAVLIALFSLMTGSGCLIKFLTGVPCPTCGMSRAALALLRLDFYHAVSMHPLVFAVPVLAALLFALKGRGRKAALISACVLVFAVYAVRMLRLFPHTAPMDFETHAVLPALINLLKNILTF